MPTTSAIRFVRVYPLAIPLRKPFRHAAHVRTEADPVVVQVELADRTLGHGETLPREYVSGETVAGVIDAIEREFLPRLLTFRPASFVEALERIDALPMFASDGRVIAAARAGVELALLDAFSRHFRKPVSDAVGWLGLPGQGPSAGPSLRYSGVLSGDELSRLKRSIRMMWWYGLRDFKLKVGYPDDAARAATVSRYLGRSLGRSATLRLDANGVWPLDEAAERLREIEEAVGEAAIACIEQPMSPDHDDDLVVLKGLTDYPLMHDESLVTMEDAQRLADMGVADAFNIRLSKNGGFLPALKLAAFARRRGAIHQLGCMVGETSILSAVGRRFAENVPGLAFLEGSYGRFLLNDDVVSRPVQFGWGGRAPSLDGLGWGVTPEPDRLRRLAREIFEMPL